MKDTIRKINELVKPLGHSLYDVEPTLEDVLVALYNKLNYLLHISNSGDIIEVFDECIYFDWQLTKTLTQQSEETQQTIKQIFEDGNNLVRCLLR